MHIDMYIDMYKQPYFIKHMNAWECHKPTAQGKWEAHLEIQEQWTVS